MKKNRLKVLVKAGLVMAPLVLGAYVATTSVVFAEEVTPAGIVSDGAAATNQAPAAEVSAAKAGPEAVARSEAQTNATSAVVEVSGSSATGKLEHISTPASPVADQAASSETAVAGAPAKADSSIEAARQGTKGQTYTVTGKVMSPVNAWGGNGFYLEDAAGKGIYVYPKKSTGVKAGESVTLTGKLDEFNGELQLTSVKNLVKEADLAVPSAKEVSLEELNAGLQATLVTIKQVTVTSQSADKNGTTTLTVADQVGHELTVRVDARTGVTNDALTEKIGKGDLINVTGILSTFKGQNQLKPFALDQFVLVKKASEVASDPVVTVGQIQGESHHSPYENQTVVVKNVVVIYVANDSQFYVQDLAPDDNPNTSDGINVFYKKHHVMVGDKLILTGKVVEFVGAGYAEKAQTDLTITQLAATKIEKDGMAPVPGPIVLGVDRIAPKEIVDSDGLSRFNPDTDGIDFWESLEGMLVKIPNGKILGPQSNKEVWVVPENYSGPQNKVGGITLEAKNLHPEKLAILFDKALVVKTGDSFEGDVVGPISYSYSNYKLLSKVADAPKIKDGGVKPEITSIVKDPNKLTIASYNIENFSANPKTTTDAKVERIARSFVEDLKGPDIVVLIEVQDNNGPDNDGTVDATKSAARLIEQIKAQGGPNYAYIDIAPINNEDGGQPGANIRTGFLYNVDRVKLSDKPKGDATTAASWTNGELTYSIARIDPSNSVWEHSRKPVIAEFEFQGQKMNVVALHLNSKRGDQGAFGRNQPVVLKSETQRHQMAAVINQFIESGIKENKNLNVAMLGDYNDFEFTKTLEIISGKTMSNLVARHEWADRFSYFYQGNNQSLDNMVLSNNLLDRYEFDMVHVNSIFMKEHGRASDHDPLLVQIDLRPQEPVRPEKPVEPVGPEKPVTPKGPEDPNRTGRSREGQKLEANVSSVFPGLGQADGKEPSESVVKEDSMLPHTGEKHNLSWIGFVSLLLTGFLVKGKRKESHD